ncbi:GGDEF domain-containing protein, partial [Staphylococcus aureus]
CLRLVAATIRENLRGQADILARYGGEEFALLLPSTGLAQAMEVADRVRAAVSALGYANPGTAEGRVTVSVGVAVRESLPLAIEELCN